MANVAWNINGDYFETCSCDYVCPCVPTNLAGRPTKGHCHFAFHIDRGRYGAVALDGLNFAVVGHSPGVMAEGNWSVGLILDERATPDQRQALSSIASGQAGGPMAALGPLIGKFLGAEAKGNARLALARAAHSHLHAFGLDWDETSGGNNGHFAPFAWQGS